MREIASTTGAGLRATGAAALAVLAFASGVASAGGGPENVAVVVNADSWASLAVANEYVHLRQIPPSNVIYLDNVPDPERIGIGDFRKRILGPVLREIGSRGLRGQIDFIAYSCDLPFAIDPKEDIKDQKLPQVITPLSSINGLTYLYEDVLVGRISYLALNSNRYMRRELPLRPSVATLLEDQQAITEAETLYRDKKWQQAANAFAVFAGKYPNEPSLQYNYACCLALAGRSEEAIAALRAAVDAGWRDSAHAARDADLATLRERADFQALLQRMATAKIELQPTTAFHNTRGFDGRGEAVPDGGRHYLLATVLGVTAGRGNSVREVLDCLRRSSAADGTRPDGAIYFVRNQDVRSTTREWAFAPAAEALEALGITARIEPGVLPNRRVDVAGAVVGAAEFDWPGSRSTLLPGAICEHLTSTGAALQERAGQTPCTEFIRHGAAGTSGTVAEPYAIQDKFPTAFVQVHYARGCTLAEAFYQSVHGPYQLLIIGDPLCQPWARRPTVRLDAIEPDSTLRGTVAIRPAATRAVGPRDVVDIGWFELFLDGVRIARLEEGETHALDTTRFADGAHELVLVGVADTPIETQGRSSVPVRFANREGEVTLVGPPGGTVRLDEELVVAASARGASQVQILHNGRVVGILFGGRGDVKIDATRLGLGPVRLYAVASADVPSTHEIRSAPLDLVITAPPVIAASGPDLPAEQRVAGLRLVVGDRAPLTVGETRSRDWLKDAGLGPGVQFSLEGYFDVRAEDLYQLQLRSNMDITLEFSQRKLQMNSRREWSYHPLNLAKGCHHLRIRGRGVDNPRLDVRLGAAGRQQLSADRFWLPGE